MYLLILIACLILLFYYHKNVEKFNVNSKWEARIDKNSDYIKNEYEDRFMKQNIVGSIDKNLKEIDKNITPIKKFIPDNSGLDNLTDHTKDPDVRVLDKPFKSEQKISDNNSGIPDLDNLKKNIMNINIVNVILLNGSRILKDVRLLKNIIKS